MCSSRHRPPAHAQSGRPFHMADLLGLAMERTGSANGRSFVGDCENRLRSYQATRGNRRVHRRLIALGQVLRPLTRATEPTISPAANKTRVVITSLPSKLPRIIATNGLT